MLTKSDLHGRYSTGTRYISPASETFVGETTVRYWCEATIEILVEEYAYHLSHPATERCIVVPRTLDGVIRAGFKPTDEEMEWFTIEIRLRFAIIKSVKSEEKIKFVL